MSKPSKVFLDHATWLEFHPVVPAPATGDERLAALVGYMIGDGTIGLKSGDKYTKLNGETSTYCQRLTGAFYSNDRDDLVEIQQSLHALGMALGANVKVKKVKAEHLEDGFQIQIGDEDCRLMMDSGVPCGKKTMQTFSVPEWIMNGSKEIKRAFVAALWGAEATTPAPSKGGVRSMRPIVMTMHKIAPTPAGTFFRDLQNLLGNLGVVATVTEVTEKRYGKTYAGTSVRISGQDNTIKFLDEVGFMFCRKKAVEGWRWSKYLKAYRAAAEKRKETACRMKAEGASYVAIGKALGITEGAAFRFLKDIEEGKGCTAGHSFPQFDEWMKDRWMPDKGLLRLAVTTTTTTEHKEVWNLLVGSHDHSYLLASGANNYNSFETMAGRVYYPFDRKEHVGKYPFNPQLPIWVGMDFNIDPMSAVVFQPQPNGELWAVGEIVQFGSNTEEVCKELDRLYWRQQKQITIYPDPAGGQRQHARGETDMDILRESGFKRIKYRRRHPFVADRVNAVNRLLRAADGSVRMRIDESCKHLINAFEQTIYKPGSRDVDKDAGVEHAADAAGYCIELEYPVRKIDIGGLSL